MDTELVLGFDAREVALPFAHSWPQERREQYLLRPDLEKPLSTDVMVWESVFHLNEQVALPKWIGPVQELWDSLERLETFLKHEDAQLTKPYQVIGVTRFLDSRLQAEMQNHFQITPAEIDKSWQLLGYDVSDTYLLSGLSNCAYTSDEIKIFRERWSPQLNQHHLFTDYEQANVFKHMSDERVKEHAPFFVYGLYLTH